MYGKPTNASLGSRSTVSEEPQSPYGTPAVFLKAQSDVAAPDDDGTYGSPLPVGARREQRDPQHTHKQKPKNKYVRGRATIASTRPISLQAAATGAIEPDYQLNSDDLRSQSGPSSISSEYTGVVHGLRSENLYQDTDDVYQLRSSVESDSARELYVADSTFEPSASQPTFAKQKKASVASIVSVARHELETDGGITSSEWFDTAIKSTAQAETMIRHAQAQVGDYIVWSLPVTGYIISMMSFDDKVYHHLIELKDVNEDGTACAEPSISLNGMRINNCHSIDQLVSDVLVVENYSLSWPIALRTCLSNREIEIPFPESPEPTTTTLPHPDAGNEEHRQTEEDENAATELISNNTESTTSTQEGLVSVVSRANGTKHYVDPNSIVQL